MSADSKSPMVSVIPGRRTKCEQIQPCEATHMIHALDPTRVIRVVSLLTLALTCAFLIGTLPLKDIWGLWGTSGLIVGAVSAIAFLLTFRSVFAFVHRNTWADEWWFPLL